MADACWLHHVTMVTQDLLYQIAMAESQLDPSARSQAGAQGLMQFMPGTWHQYGHGSPFNPDKATLAARIYLDYLMRLFHGELAKMLAAYNCGENHVLGLISRWGDDWSYHLPHQTERL
jgi:soluble lytic murein transglycosylase-like protein